MTTATRKPLISVKESRKLLGKYADRYTNEELEGLINDSESVVRILIDQFLRSKNDKIEYEE